MSISLEQQVVAHINPKITTHKIHSAKLNLDFNVHYQDETVPNISKCYLMTIHDLGCDHSQFVEFVSQPEMKGLKERTVWLHVDLPGQENNAIDLKIEKYPTLVAIGQALVDILDYFKISQITCFGEGAGANISARFAIQWPNRCLGVILLNPSASSATFLDTMKDKIRQLSNKGMNAKHEAYLLWHRYGQRGGDEQLIQANKKEFQVKLFEKRNPNNLALFIDSYLSRSNILETIDCIKVDVLTAFGRRSANASETKRFYKALYDARKNDIQNLVNSPLLEVEDVGDIMGETPDRLAISIQFFLQGIGLVSALPMKKTLQGMGRLSRAMSMEDADRPRRASIMETSNLVAN